MTAHYYTLKIYEKDFIALKLDKEIITRSKWKNLLNLDYRTHIYRTECSLSRYPRIFWKYVRDLTEKSPISISIHYQGFLSNNPSESVTFFLIILRPFFISSLVYYFLTLLDSPTIVPQTETSSQITS